jgi:hypothetical protein
VTDVQNAVEPRAGFGRASVDPTDARNAPGHRGRQISCVPSVRPGHRIVVVHRSLGLTPSAGAGAPVCAARSAWSRRSGSADRVRPIEAPCRGRQAPFTGPGAATAASVPLTAFTRAGATGSPRCASRRNAGLRKREPRLGVCNGTLGRDRIADPLEQDRCREVRPAVLGAEQPDLRIAELQVDGLSGEPDPSVGRQPGPRTTTMGYQAPQSWPFLRSGRSAVG